ncbi:MAG: inositol-3-phosphate synthase [Thermodesulfovibrio sp.]|uniref:inositol-3-phosphate synthase n=1 Tax=unclassified Thermodesulfovibrio TaxID=2645936 RepID=UPI00083B4E60|nr:MULTISPECIES: inositol-3-phosphate synthase [unclassified Thermodesulfovibrio]MDI1472532.1 inositol-3-phosphate synthase [Thermodesulfovibrio sp. 1176]MDI6714431.1 inositol-3-phosphate synthase [Thermodesulfovibrio sp.]ODA44867.1 Inositol-1-phosphate synthase [Thermodesulfovibrio sp. N1]
MGKIKLAIVGLGNCASALIQGIEYYKKYTSQDKVPGLMHFNLGGYLPGDIEVVAAFDIDERKVNKPLKEAVFAKPNCTKIFYSDLPDYPVKVSMGPVLDGFAEHMENYSPDKRFIPAQAEPVDVVKVLKESGAEVMVSYLPVGSEEATRFYAQAALDAGVAFINCIPVFVASKDEWIKKFEEKNIPLIGDDIKSQIGATIIHRVLTKLCMDRGVRITNTYQLNVGGNTDFLNMLNRERLASKKISKTEAVTSQISHEITADNVHIGPSDYIPWLNDNKICFLRIEGEIFGNVPINLELRLSVEDSPNSAGVVIDAIRCCKLALDRGIGGLLISPSAYFMKHPRFQYPDEVAKNMVEEFIEGKRER